MAGPYSMDLRERVVAAYLAREGTYPQLAKRFSIGTRTVERWVDAHRKTGSCAPQPMGGDRRGKFDAPADAELRRLTEKDSSASAEELVVQLRDGIELHTSPSGVRRARKRLGLTRKKRRSTLRNGTPSASKP